MWRHCKLHGMDQVAAAGSRHEMCSRACAPAGLARQPCRLISHWGRSPMKGIPSGRPAGAENDRQFIWGMTGIPCQRVNAARKQPFWRGYMALG